MNKGFGAATFILWLAGAALSQAPTSMHCSKPENEWTTVCLFDDGTVNVTSAPKGGPYSSDWYTKDEWIRFVNHVHEPPTEEQTIVATAKLCKKGDFNKGYCAAFGPKHKLSPNYWECLLWDGTDTSYISCRDLKSAK